MPIPTVSLDHPDLGTFIGQQVDGVQQYLGIQYATLANRLAEPQLKTRYNSPVDSTEYGPAAYGPPSGFDNEVNLFIQQPLPKPELTYSDTDCLNLNITIPTPGPGTVTGATKLPVFIWIHGGGFVLGANSWPQYDHAKLVQLAAKTSVPVLGVGISFRLGLPALLTSEELRAAGYKANNLLRDQRAAFQWVRQFISGFGGDSDNITVIGESSGAMATTLHLLSSEPLFQRAIATGGTCFLRKPMPAPPHEHIYQQVVKQLGIDQMSSEDRTKALLTIPMEEIIEKLSPAVTFNAFIDCEIIKSEATHATVKGQAGTAIPGKDWLQDLLVGDCQFDASVLTYLLAGLRPKALAYFPPAVRDSLPAKMADAVLEMYNFPSGTTSASEEDHTRAFDAVIAYINDVGYYLSTLSFAEGFSRPNDSSQGSSIFFFNHGNPWDGPFKGKASHVLDVVFLFQNYNHLMSEQQRISAEKFGIDMMKFVRGEWELSNKSADALTAVVYGDEGIKIADARNGEEVGRNSKILEIAHAVGRDKLMDVFERFAMTASMAS